jgi:hypothetical protein
MKCACVGLSPTKQPIYVGNIRVKNIIMSILQGGLIFGRGGIRTLLLHPEALVEGGINGGNSIL